MKRIKTLLTLVSVMAIAMSLFVAPANAAGAGQLAFTCTASLPNFPAPPNTTGGTCNGSASGAIIGTGGQKAVVQGSFNASFSYTEPAATCPATGTASGTFSVDGGAATGKFSWERVGATAVITLSNVSVPAAGISGATGVAVAAFESPNAVTNCLAGGGPLTATVAGSATVVGA